LPPTQPAALRILFATPECAPLAKTGGLGDVSSALPAALRAIGLDARVLLPGYPGVAGSAKELARLSVLGTEVRLLESRLPNGVPLVVVDAPPLYARRGGPYQTEDGDDWEDNPRRFGVLSKVAALLGSADSPLAWRADVVHCNDWPTALAPVYLRSMKGARAASLITIHNLAFQGVFDYDDINALELPEAARGMDGVEFYGRASFLKGGLVCADAINTVSPTYAKEIQTPELGFGLDGVLRQRRAHLSGVLNGIDTDVWNPQSDPLIAMRYGTAALEAKATNKRALKSRLGLAGPDDVPLLATVARLTHQKGIDVIVDALPQLVALPAQVVVVGAGDRVMAQRLRAEHARFPQSIAVFIGFDESLAHLVEAGADIFLMPSRFEPCGMNQMYSQRYGTPPIATATGGLVDTIVDATSERDEAATGFLMKRADPAELLEAARIAVNVYREPSRWKLLQVNGMQRDFGWTRAAHDYAAIYRRIKATS
jgi:starch synthase